MQENNTQNNNITEKIRNNAIISYLFILVNITFLYSKNNKNISNNFVRSHTKTAILIHLGFLINIIIFVKLGLGINTEIIGYNISDIIAIIIFLILFGFLIIGIYKAYNYKTFKISESLDFKKNKKLLDISNDGKFSEKDKLTILFSLIPFIGYVISPKYRNNKLIENNVKLNLLITFIITLLYIFGNPNLANLLLLIYIIFIVFSGINLFMQNKIINLNLNKIPNPSKILDYFKATKIYLWNYFKNSKNFQNFSEIINSINSENKNNNLSQEKELLKKPDFKLSNYLIYIPILNIVSLFNKNVKQKKHIINGIILSFIFIIILILDFLYGNYNIYLLLLLFPIFFGIGYLNANILNYEMPFIYDIFNFLNGINNKIKKLFTKAKTLKNTEKNVSMKVGDEKKENKKSV